MSSFVTSDLTVLAIVQGMAAHGYTGTGAGDAEDMAEALRIINERSVDDLYHESSRHEKVNLNKSRDFTDAEIWTSCRCWLYQVETGRHFTFDEITIKSAVKMLANEIVRSGEADGTWKTDTILGQTIYYTRDCDGNWVDAYDLAEWDLAA